LSREVGVVLAYQNRYDR